MGIMGDPFMVVNMTLKAVARLLLVMPVGRGLGMTYGTRHPGMGRACIFTLADQGKPLPGQRPGRLTASTVTVEA